MAKHLVTGACGFLGSEIVKKLSGLGEEVVSIDIFEDKEISKISKFYQIDISKSLEDHSHIFKDVKYVHHNAALIPISKSSYKQFYDVNVLGTKNVLDRSIKSNVEHFSHMSSSAIFGAPEKNQNVNTNILNPKEDYGISKSLAEQEVLKVFNEDKKYFKSCSIIRPRTIVGKNRLGIFGILFDWVINDKKIPIIGNGENKFQFAHFDDLTEVSVETALKNISGYFNIGTDKYSTLKEDLNSFFSYVNSKSKVLPINKDLCVGSLYLLGKLKLSPLTAYHSLVYHKNFYYNLDETFKKLSWRPKYSNVEMLCEAFNWYKLNYKLLKQNNSIHKSVIKQKIFRVIKFFL